MVGGVLAAAFLCRDRHPQAGGDGLGADRDDPGLGPGWGARTGGCLAAQEGLFLEVTGLLEPGVAAVRC